MKLKVILFIFCCLPTVGANAQDHSGKTDTVEVIQEFRNLYHFQNYYLSGQPSYETLQWLKSKGVHTIINLRSEKENSDFASSSFNEETISREFGFEYHNVPVDGIKDYTPEKLDTFAGLLTGKETTLIHCASAYRATDFFMAYLVKARGYTVNEAAEIGRKLKFTLPLEKLIDAEISLKLKD